jgi:Protein of unknown function (DUF1326)
MPAARRSSALTEACDSISVPLQRYAARRPELAGLYKWPSEIKDGNGRRQIVIDERADEAQRIALETIVSGEACEPLSNLFSVFASTCSVFCETLFLPINLEADSGLRTARDTRRQEEQRQADDQRV